MKAEQLVKKFKAHLEAKTGIELDFRKHQFLDNQYGATPCFDYDFAEKVVACLYSWAHSYIKKNKENYPEFGGWEYNPQMECEKLRSSKLQALVESVCEALWMEFTEKYRFDHAYGSVYEYSNGSYVFIGKLNGRTEKEFLKDYEDRL